jgi:hypothetical protein
MTRPARSPADAYLDELAATLPRGRASRDLLDEMRDYLCEATAAGESAGVGRDAAEREAVRGLGSVEELAPQFRAAAVVCDARQQALRQLLGILLLVGWSAIVAHLLPAALGRLALPMRPPTATHAAAGALLGPSFLLLGLTCAPWPWHDARWLAWLARSRALASWLFQPSMAACAALLAHPVASAFDTPHLWLAASALGGHLVAIRLVPIAGADHLLGRLTRRR